MQTYVGPRAAPVRVHVQPVRLLRLRRPGLHARQLPRGLHLHVGPGRAGFQRVQEDVQRAESDPGAKFLGGDAGLCRRYGQVNYFDFFRLKPGIKTFLEY